MSSQSRDSTASLNINNDVSNSGSAAQELKVWNCLNCRRRKVRCDRRFPCAPCIKNKANCNFPVSGRIPRRSRDAHVKKQTELVGRLRRLESMVGDLSSQVERSTGISQENYEDLDLNSTSVSGAKSATSSEKDSSDSRNVHKNLSGGSSFVAGQPLYGHGNTIEDAEITSMPENATDLDIASNGDIIVGNRFWSVFCKEVEDIFEAVQGSTVISFEGHDNSATKSTLSNGHHTGYYNFLLRNASATHQSDELHLLPSQMPFLWQIYRDNVDPFIKVLHVPSVTSTIGDLKSGRASLDYRKRALLLVVSLAAVMSLKDDQAQMKFGIEKEQIYARYLANIELALEKADFLENTDMTVLQAFTIYLTVLQNSGKTQPVWFLNGTLIRLAVSLNLHCGSPQFANFTLLEIEMRRRLWWQICLIDSRSHRSHDSRYKLSERDFDTKMPTNRDDLDLEPITSISSPAPDKWTDTTIFILRCEIWKLSQHLQSIHQSKPASLTVTAESFNLFQHSRTKIERSYLRHFDPTNPLHTFTSTSTNLFLAKVDFILISTLHPSKNSAQTPTSPLGQSFHTALSIITYTNALQHTPEWESYRWQLSNQRNPPWYTLRFVLTRLCTTTAWTSVCEDAFLAVRKSMEDCSDLTVRQDSRCQDILSLVDAVEKHRAEKHDHSNISDGGSAAAMDVRTATDLPSSAIRESSREDPTLSMDWRSWNGNGEDFGSPFDFWDLDGF